MGQRARGRAEELFDLRNNVKIAEGLIQELSLNNCSPKVEG